MPSPPVFSWDRQSPRQPLPLRTPLSSMALLADPWLWYWLTRDWKRASNGLNTHFQQHTKINDAASDCGSRRPLQAKPPPLSHGENPIFCNVFLKKLFKTLLFRSFYHNEKDMIPSVTLTEIIAEYICSEKLRGSLSHTHKGWKGGGSLKADVPTDS